MGGGDVQNCRKLPAGDSDDIEWMLEPLIDSRGPGDVTKVINYDHGENNT